MAAPLTIDYVADWRARLRGKLYTQYRNKATWELWVQLFGRQAQDLEDAAQTLLTIWDIDNSEGVGLDRIGRAIGQKRLGVGDVLYRLYLKARVLANKSSGTPEEIYKVMRALFGVDAAPTYFGGFVKAFAIRLGYPISETEGLIGGTFLRDAKESGARANFEWQEYPDNLMFTFGLMTKLTAPATPASTTLSVESTEGMGDSVALYIDRGVPGLEDIIVYGVTSPTTLALFSSVAYTHPAGSDVTLVYGDPGLGFDDGYFASAVEA